MLFSLSARGGAGAPSLSKLWAAGGGAPQQAAGPVAHSSRPSSPTPRARYGRSPATIRRSQGAVSNHKRSHRKIQTPCQACTRKGCVRFLRFFHPRKFRTTSAYSQSTARSISMRPRAHMHPINNSLLTKVSLSMSTTAIKHARPDRSLGLRGHIVSRPDASTLLHSIMEARFNSKLRRFVASETRAAPPIRLLGPESTSIYRAARHDLHTVVLGFNPYSVTISGALFNDSEYAI